MKEYTVHSGQPDARPQLDSVLQQMRDAALKGESFKAHVQPGKSTLTLTLSIDLSEQQLKSAGERALAAPVAPEQSTG